MRRAINLSPVGLIFAAAISNVCLAQAIATPPSAPGDVVPAPSLPSPASVPSPVVIRTSVNLDSANALDDLRATNFSYYLRAREILAAGNEICQPEVPGAFTLQRTLLLARFDGDSLRCGMWLTSLPPKRSLSFVLGDVRYYALVSVTFSGNVLQTGAAKSK